MWSVILGNVNQLSFTPSIHNAVNILSPLCPLLSHPLSTFMVSKMESYIRKTEREKVRALVF